MTNPYDLPNLPTKVLLNYLEKARSKRHKGHTPIPGGRMLSVVEIKTELTKREHVPNKVEARALRQEKAKESYREQARKNRRKKLKKRRGW
ncbi:hypothetical protein HN858_04045 [Candidatus Falkowbacteria bacterium]|jgi:hypothetical protein|nr:hypothetical protein [Candidatus Falkowbacteria bacterium]MBT5502654.1 hypothetical protein [Candidatus Falkowbacteria bacterium]MBT6573541.1 hypothetical protein [Candidatus Falkowbacteria bacterium]MBT7348819.1 hypothetical protein [Candidatus Falkowbacteria bacterium]MBT7501214.1 hypothetical protein [Candidatus Falkowbacteria bacterium]